MRDYFQSIDDSVESRKKFANKLYDSKYNLDSIISDYTIIRQCFFGKAMHPHEQEKFPEKEFEFRLYGNLNKVSIKDNVYIDLITLIDTMIPSLIAPFHHYNNYIDSLCKDFLWDDIKFTLSENEVGSSGVLRKTQYQIEIQALLISLKAGLDRLVSFFSYYYKGISPHTTFGRYKEKKGKFEGFMNTVSINREVDGLMNFVYKEYFDWIKIAVAPRDTITHYNDLGIYYEFNNDIQGEIPVHFNERLIKEKDSSDAPVYIYTYQTMKEFTESWYNFTITVFNGLINKELMSYRQKF